MSLFALTRNREGDKSLSMAHKLARQSAVCNKVIKAVVNEKPLMFYEHLFWLVRQYVLSATNILCKIFFHSISIAGLPVTE